MDELANTLLNRISGLARKGLDPELNEEQRKVCFIRIGENVKLIKRVEKLDTSAEDAVDDEDVNPAAAPARGHRRSERVPAAKAG